MNNIELTINSITDVESRDMSGHNFQHFPLNNNTWQKLQHIHNDIYFKNVFNQIEIGNIQEGQLYIVRNNILKRYVTEGDSTYETTVIPRALFDRFLDWFMMNWDTMVPIGLYLVQKVVLLERFKTKC